MFVETMLVLGLVQGAPITRTPKWWLQRDELASIGAQELGSRAATVLAGQQHAATLAKFGLLGVNSGLNMGTPSIMADANAVSRDRAGIVSELLSYKKLCSDEPDDVRASLFSAIDWAIQLVSAVPLHVPPPKPMLLSDQAGLYWETDEAYAEIDIGADGIASAFGRRSGMSDVLIDEFRLRSLAGGTAFPSALEAIITPAG